MYRASDECFIRPETVARAIVQCAMLTSMPTSMPELAHTAVSRETGRPRRSHEWCSHFIAKVVFSHAESSNKKM